MAEPGDEVQSWFAGLSYKLKRELARAIKEQADGLAEAVKAAAPVRTGRLRDSIKVRRKRGELELEVTAGGDATASRYDRGTDYNSEVNIDGGDNSGKAKVAKGHGEGVVFDYALAAEFGTVKQEAEPWFYPTYRAREAGMREAIEGAVAEAINKA